MKILQLLILLCLSFSAFADIPVDAKWVKRKTEMARLRIPAAGLAAGDQVSLNVRIPENSVIVNTFGIVKTEMDDDASPSSLSIGCESSPDLIATFFPAGSGAGSLISGEADGTQANYIYVENGCRVTAYVGSGVFGSPGSTQDGFTEGVFLTPIEYYEVR